MNKNNKNPFITPEGYFNSFQDRLMDKLSTNESEIPKETGFKVPDNYFETLQDNLSEKLENKEVKVVPLFNTKRLIGFAASVAAIVCLYIGFNWNTTEELSFSDLANADIDAYFDNHEFDVSTYDIAEVLPVEDMEISDIINHNIKEENILEYLNENLDDFDELNLDDDE